MGRNVILYWYAGIAQLVERNLAKVEVASSNLVSRSILIALYQVLKITLMIALRITWPRGQPLVSISAKSDYEVCRSAWHIDSNY